MLLGGGVGTKRQETGDIRLVPRLLYPWALLFVSEPQCHSPLSLSTSQGYTNERERS